MKKRLKKVWREIKKAYLCNPQTKRGSPKGTEVREETSYLSLERAVPGRNKGVGQASWNIPEQMQGSQGAMFRSYLPVMRKRATADRRGRCPGETFEVHFELMSRRTSEEGKNLLE